MNQEELYPETVQSQHLSEVDSLLQMINEKVANDDANTTPFLEDFAHENSFNRGKFVNAQLKPHANSISLVLVEE